MRRLTGLFALMLALFVAAPTRVEAKQPKCPLPLTECMLQFAKMRERGWLGVEYDVDSTTKVATVIRVVPGGPCDKAGVRAGDVIQKVTGFDQKWIAGKAGWKDAKPVQVAVLRGGVPQTISVECGVIPDDYLAELIGVHVLEGHLAYMTGKDDEPEAH